MIRRPTSCRSRSSSPAPYVLLVNPVAAGANTVPDLIRARQGQARPALLRLGRAGTPHHLFPHLFKTMTRIEMNHVPYRGSVPALTDVAAGHVELMFSDVPPALSLINEGKVRALGVSTKERVPALPHLAPIAEQGVTGFDAASWQMVVAPAGTPKDVIERLHTEIKDFMVTVGDQANMCPRWACSPSTRPRLPTCTSSCRRRSLVGGKSWNRPASPARNDECLARPLVPSERGPARGGRHANRAQMTAPLLAVRGVKAYYGHIAALRGVDVDVGRGRDRGADRRERRRQIDIDDDDLRQSARPRRPHHLRRPRHHAAADARHRAAENRAGAGRPPHLRAHERIGEPADGRRGRRLRAFLMPTSSASLRCFRA